MWRNSHKTWLMYAARKDLTLSPSLSLSLLLFASLCLSFSPLSSPSSIIYVRRRERPSLINGWNLSSVNYPVRPTKFSNVFLTRSTRKTAERHADTQTDWQTDRREEAGGSRGRQGEAGGEEGGGEAFWNCSRTTRRAKRNTTAVELRRSEWRQRSRSRWNADEPHMNRDELASTRTERPLFQFQFN